MNINLLKRHCLLILLLTITTFPALAQMLETVDFSVPGTHYNNYVNAINNKGYLCGYYTPTNGTDIGFIISPSGKKMTVDPQQIGYTGTQVTGINDHGVAVVYATSLGGNAIYKAYIDSVADTIASLVLVNNISQPSSVPFKINNNNDIAGWFQASTRFLWVKHDSIVPTGCLDYEGDRYVDNGPNFYNTFGAGINDACQVAGYYVNAPNYCPFVYDDINHTFTVLNTNAFYRLHGINNNNIICGDYKQINGFYMGFYATYAGGALTQFHSLNTIFQTNAMTSVASGVNDSGVVVGSFTHPITGASVGFIYHPYTAEYAIPGFDFTHHAWKLVNSSGVPNAVWSSSYWSGAQYATQDPYANITDPPLLDTYIRGLYAPNYITGFMTDSVCPTWQGFASEMDDQHMGTSGNYFIQQYYANILKHTAWQNYSTKLRSGFNGFCYGFVYSSLLHYFNDTLFSNWFGIPTGTDISQVPQSNVLAVRAIERSFLKQYDQSCHQYNPGLHNKVELWEGLYRLKCTFQQPFAICDPRGVTLGLHQVGNVNNITGYHIVLPYKIRTPRLLPFDYPAGSIAYDTVFVYDSNFPTNPDEHFLVNSVTYAPPHDSASNPSYPNMSHISFNESGIREFYSLPYTQFKTTNTSPDSKYLTLAIHPNLYYVINDTANTSATLNAAGYTNSTANLTPLFTKEINSQSPVGHSMDTAYSVTAASYNYVDSYMIWSQTNTNRSMGLSRIALPSETDYSTFKNRFISYGNHDNVTKYLTGNYTETTTDRSQGSSILVSGICAAQGDSIITENPYPYAYEVIKVNGTDTCSYNLTVFAAYGDTVKEFHAGNITLTPNTSHTIDPYYTGLNGSQVVVYIDHGMTGSYQDTLFITGFPVQVPNLSGLASISIHPNPVSNDLSLDIKASQQESYSIMLTDIVGSLVYSKNVTVTSGTVSIPMAGYATGMYIIRVTDMKGHVLYNSKVTKQ